jgi:hypothetical protein
MKIGMKEGFRNWLASQGLSYTRYTKLDVKAKADLYARYQKKGKPDEAVVACTK